MLWSYSNLIGKYELPTTNEHSFNVFSFELTFGKGPCLGWQWIPNLLLRCGRRLGLQKPIPQTRSNPSGGPRYFSTLYLAWERGNSHSLSQYKNPCTTHRFLLHLFWASFSWFEKEQEMAESSSSSSALGTAVKSDAEIEDMLDRMLTSLALCDDSKLQPLLSKILPFTISSLSTQSTLVRNKVCSFSPSTYTYTYRYMLSMYITVAWNYLICLKFLLGLLVLSNLFLFF